MPCQMCRACKLRIEANPATDMENIEVVDQTPDENQKSGTGQLFIYDKHMQLKQMQYVQGRKALIDVSNLPADVYIVRYKLGNKLLENKLVVTRK
jgi:hypothetical protein